MVYMHRLHCTSTAHNPPGVSSKLKTLLLATDNKAEKDAVGNDELKYQEPQRLLPVEHVLNPRELFGPTST